MKHHMIRSSHRSGGTKINVVVTLLVLVILTALTLPAVQQAREAARRSQCKNNLKQIGLAMMNYHDVHRTLPPGVTVAQVPQSVGGNHFGWIFHTLPYYDASHLFRRFNSKLDITATGPGSNSELTGIIRSGFRCPSDWGPDQDSGGSFGNRFNMGTANYVGNFGVGYPSLDMHPEDCQGTVGPNSKIRIRDVKDGMSNVILAAERRNPKRCGTFVASDLGIASPNGGCSFWAGSANAQTDLMTIVAPMQGRGDPAIPLFQILGTTRSGSVTDSVQNSPEGSLGQGSTLWDSAAGTVKINTTISRVNGVDSVVRMSGDNQDKTTVGFSSWHMGGIQAVLGDGTVRFISELVDPDVYQNLSRRSDGQTLGEF
jgi:type II secretory pathway pseudopilin PulG